MTHADADAAGHAYWFPDTLAVVHRATPPLVIEVTVPPGGSPPLTFTAGHELMTGLRERTPR